MNLLYFVYSRCYLAISHRNYWFRNRHVAMLLYSNVSIDVETMTTPQTSLEQTGSNGARWSISNLGISVRSSYWVEYRGWQVYSQTDQINPKKLNSKEASDLKLEIASFEVLSLNIVLVGKGLANIYTNTGGNKSSQFRFMSRYHLN